MATRTRKRTSPDPLALVPVSPPDADPKDTAEEAGLVHVTGEGPGYTRKRAGKRFAYFDTKGRRIGDARTIARIDALGIPPAHVDVWICPDPRGHLQATGRDARGRKQYVYHPKWRESRECLKYQRMLAFGAALPRIREAVARDMAEPGLGRRKVLATVVRLLETTLIRVGNEEYARANDSFGLTTLRDEHVDVEGPRLVFHFRGKSGKTHEIGLKDARLARIVRGCRDLPGQDLFQYADADGTRHAIGSADVNEYLKEVAGEGFTAKDFRTWAGTVLATLALQSFDAFENPTQAKRNLMAAVKSVASRLGNTPAVCRKSYIHPAVIDAYLEGTMLESLKALVEAGIQDARAGLDRDEVCVLAFLAARLAREKERDAERDGRAAQGRREDRDEAPGTRGRRRTRAAVHHRVHAEQRRGVLHPPA